MSKLKPIGSEKLQGSAKLNRMLEIAMYKEVDKANINETSSKEYDIQLTDGNVYAIVKEKVGYIIKKGLNESTLDYIDPIRNRKYYRSYSQAFKKLNLITKELNVLYDNPNGVSLFGEQKKFTLKTPKPAQPNSEMGDMPAPPPEPPPVPNPELPPSPLEGGEGQMPPDMGGMDDMGAMPPPADSGMDDMGGEMPDMDMEDEPMQPKQGKGDEEVTFKTIQKLTGRLTQKIRTLENEEGLTSEEIKYVINMVISSLNIDVLDDEDVDDILSKFEGGGEEGDMEGEMPDMEGMDDMGGMPDMEGMPDMGGEMPQGGAMPDMGAMPQGGEEYAPKKRYAESKVDRIISNYFELSPQEKVLSEQKKRKLEKSLNENLQSLKILSETQKQYSAATNFLNKFKRFNVMGKTNLGNIMLKLNENSVKVNKNGMILESDEIEPKKKDFKWKLVNDPNSITKEELNFKGDLKLNFEKITSLPEGLEIDGNLEFSHTNIESLPKGLKVNGDLILQGESITSLPEDLEVLGNLHIFSCFKLTTIPNGLQVGGDMKVIGSTDINLPEGFEFRGNLHLVAIGYLKKLPNNMDIKGDLVLQHNPDLKTLPKGLKVGGNLDTRATKIYSLPDDLKVVGDLYGGRDMSLNNVNKSQYLPYGYIKGKIDNNYYNRMYKIG